VRAINLIVGCTNRKRYPTPAGLALRDVGGSDLDERLRIWRERLRGVPADVHPADRLYMGDHWAVAHGIPNRIAGTGLDVRLWVCSAGYGLIHSRSLVKSYQATFAPGTEDYVAAGVADHSAGIRNWWRGVCKMRLVDTRPAPRTLAQLGAAHPRTPMLVALSLDYLDAVAEDLQQVLRHQFFQEFLSIVSCGTLAQRSAWAQNLLPCNGHMAGTLGGTLTSINVRVARYLLESLDGGAPSVDRMTTLARSIPRSATATRTGEARTDDQVLAFIRACLRRTPTPSRTKLLREYRDSGKACEQQRFAELYRAEHAKERT
jgi:hypothetical protein